VAGSWDVAIVGGGAAGLAAAIGAARSGATVVIAERMPRLGKKILATGGGRCNLLNENLSPAAYSSTDPDLVASVFRQVGKEDIKAFFQGLGLAMIVEESRVFPATNQAATVLKVLELEVRRLAVAVELGFEAKTLERRGKSSSLVAVDGRRIDARTAVLAAGGKSYPALGSNGSGLDLARRLGHRIITPVPSAVPLLVKDRLCQALQGQKIKARASAWVMGRKAAEAEGELLFTAYGLSGTAVLDVSEPISTALNRKGGKDVVLAVDLVPFLSREDLASELARRLDRGLSFPDVAAGILPQKFGPLLSGFIPAADVQKRAAAYSLAAALKNKKFAVQGTRGWNEAEFTSGGVHAGEISPSTLESRRWPGLFFAGEILDVQGPRGGYNLAWAWASGLVAGRSAAGRP
jgi:predicted Rossmann fold flavoprotein